MTSTERVRRWRARNRTEPRQRIQVQPHVVDVMDMHCYEWLSVEFVQDRLSALKPASVAQALRNLHNRGLLQRREVDGGLGATRVEYRAPGRLL